MDLWISILLVVDIGLLISLLAVRIWMKKIFMDGMKMIGGFTARKSGVPMVVRYRG